MKREFCLAAVISVAFLITSCGAGKKLEVSQGQVSELSDKNAKLNQNVEQLSAEVTRLTNQNSKMASDFDQYRNQCEAVRRKYRAANEILDEQERMLTQIEEKLVAALTDLEQRGLTVVSHKRGLVYVSLEDQLLYKSGSPKLDKNGVDALSKIAEVMNDYADVRVIVVGNTDDVKFKTGTNDNWSLSTERANGVVMALRDVYKIDPARLTSAGRGKFNPVADNSTAEGRAKNRRTDIIFNPDLDKMWDSIE